MIAVVTGGSGFIGRNLIRQLKASGAEVRCLMRPQGGVAPPGARRFVVDYGVPQSLIESPAFDGADAVFHLAGATRAIRPDRFHAGNVTPTRHVLGALSARRLRPRFVYVSSQAAAGPASSATQAVDETDPPHPIEPYGRSKLEAERVVESFQDRVPITIVRPCAVFGAHDRDFLSLFRFARRGIIVYPGVRDHWLSLLHVDDVVSGLMTAATSDRAISRTFFLSSNEPVQWQAVGEAVATAIGRPVRHLNLPSAVVSAAATAGECLGWITRRPTLASRSRAALSRQPYWVCSASLARAELGFAERRSLPEAMRQTYYWYRQSGWLRGSPGAGRADA
jgi:nucleoside-diphosphate-sugar epimerase